MRAILIANGWLSAAVDLQAGDLLIAADGGARHCLRHNLRPDVVIGDMDSLDDHELQILESQGAQIIRFPTRKDYTDLELAVQHALKMGANEIVIYAALGARWDQTIANLLLPSISSAARLWLVDGSQEIHLLRGGEALVLQGRPGDTVSLIALSAEASGIRTEHLEYPLEDETLHLGSTRGVSNVLLAERARIQLTKGLLICTILHAG